MQNKLLADCEVYLDHNINSDLINDKPQDSVERLLDRLAARVESSFDKTLGEFASQMVNFTAGLQKAMEDVNGIFEAQREHSERFAATTTQLDQFGQRFNETTKELGTIQKRSIRASTHSQKHFLIRTAAKNKQRPPHTRSAKVRAAYPAL